MLLGKPPWGREGMGTGEEGEAAFPQADEGRYADAGQLIEMPGPELWEMY